MNTLRTKGAALLMATVAAACRSVEPQDSSTLEVVAVRADQPTGTPGALIHLEMLTSIDTNFDGHSPTNVPLQIVWFAGCNNPPGGEYFGCFDAMRRELGTLAPRLLDNSPTELLGFGNAFDFRIPVDVLEGQSTFGTSFVFFAVCEGELRLAPEVANSIPLRCIDALGHTVGRDRFAEGFTTIPTPRLFGNANPWIEGIQFDGEALLASACKTDVECQSLGGKQTPQTCMDIDGSGHCTPILQRCSPASCQSHEITLALPDAVAEPNPLAVQASGEIPREILHLRAMGRYLDQELEFTWFDGQWTKPPRFVVGVPERFEGDRTAIWLVLRDNRGGVGYERLDFAVAKD